MKLNSRLVFDQGGRRGAGGGRVAAGVGATAPAAGSAKDRRRFVFDADGRAAAVCNDRNRNRFSWSSVQLKLDIPKIKKSIKTVNKL